MYQKWNTHLVFGWWLIDQNKISCHFFGNRLIFFQEESPTFVALRLLNMTICCVSLSFMTLNEKSFGFCNAVMRFVTVFLAFYWLNDESTGRENSQPQMWKSSRFNLHYCRLFIILIPPFLKYKVFKKVLIVCICHLLFTVQSQFFKFYVSKPVSEVSLHAAKNNVLLGKIHNL